MEDKEQNIPIRVAVKTGNPGKNSKPLSAETLKKRIEEGKRLGLN